MRCAVYFLVGMAAWAQSGIVTGSVADAVTKVPITGASIEVLRGETAVQKGLSDAAGRFRLEGLAEGPFRLRIRHDGYLGLAADDAAAQLFVLPASRPVVNLSAQLAPLAEIQGRVVYPNREPVAKIGVGMRRPWQTHWSQTTMTGEDGQFRVPRLEPGTWILAALPSFRHQSADPKRSLKPIVGPEEVEQQRMRWLTTFYPNAVTPMDAGRILLAPGASLRGHDVTLRTAPVRRLSGRVVDEAGEPVAKAGVLLSDLASHGGNGGLSVADGDGRFVFEAGTDGEWRLFGQEAGPGRGLKGYVDVRVAHTDVEEIELRLTPPFAVTGTVEREEPRDAEGKRKVTGVYLLPDGAGPDVQAQAFHEQDGSLLLKRVYQGRYRVLPVGYVPGYYVASVWYGDQEVTTRVFDIVSPPLPLRVVYKSGAGRVTGKVDRGEGKWVVLVPQDEALRDSDQHIRSAKCDTNGRFSIESLRPGSYYAFAFDRVRRELLEDAAFVRALEAKAEPVEVRHGETATVELSPQVWSDY